MNKFNRNNLKDIWSMRDLTVRDFFAELSNHPDLKFLITTVGFWWLTRFVMAITIGANVIYYVFRIFRLVIG